jgi:hypothetical protein
MFLPPLNHGTPVKRSDGDASTPHRAMAVKSLPVEPGSSRGAKNAAAASELAAVLGVGDHSTSAARVSGKQSSTGSEAPAWATTKQLSNGSDGMAARAMKQPYSLGSDTARDARLNPRATSTMSLGTGLAVPGGGVGGGHGGDGKRGRNRAPSVASRASRASRAQSTIAPVSNSDEERRRRAKESGSLSTLPSQLPAPRIANETGSTKNPYDYDRICSLDPVGLDGFDISPITFQEEKKKGHSVQCSDFSNRIFKPFFFFFFFLSLLPLSYPSLRIDLPLSDSGSDGPGDEDLSVSIRTHSPSTDGEELDFHGSKVRTRVFPLFFHAFHFFPPSKT